MPLGEVINMQTAAGGWRKSRAVRLLVLMVTAACAAAFLATLHPSRSAGGPMQSATPAKPQPENKAGQNAGGQAEENPGQKSPAPTDESDVIRAARLEEIKNRLLNPSPPPPGSTLVLLFHNRTEYFLGENILIDYRLENISNQPIRYEKGAFYPTLRRHDAFRVIAEPVDENGKVIGPPAESIPGPSDHEGKISEWKLAPGEVYTQTLYLPRYVRLEKPGQYRIQIANVYRMNPKIIFSSGETTITLKQPTPAEALAIYQRMKKLPQQPVAGTGEKKSVEIADFEVLIAPVYLPILREQALLGDRDALAGLGKMCTAEANAALIALIEQSMEKDDLDLALAAYGRINGLRDPRLYPGFYNNDTQPKDRESIEQQAVVERVWRPEFADPLRRLAARLAGDPKPIGLEQICRIYEALGKPEDLENVTAAYTKAIELTRTLPPETHQYPSPRGAAYIYPFSIRLLFKRGAKPPTDPKTPGEIGAYLVALRFQNDFRPDGWAERVAGWLDHEIPYVRELVLQSVPEPIPQSLLDGLPKLLSFNNPDLQIAACRLAQKHPCKAYREPLLKILRQGRASKEEFIVQEYLLNAAADAAQANRITNDQLAEIWLARSDNSDLGADGFHRLIHTVIDYKGRERRPGRTGLAPEDQAAAAKVWRQFIDQHQQELHEGHRFKLGDPEITPELFPPGFHFYLNNRPWPQ